MHRAELAALAPRKLPYEREQIRQYQYKGRVRPFSGKGITLHPGQLIIGTTLEYFKMPLDVMGYVIGRSSWGRLGLIVATATFIDPGFRGVIVLELVNDGEVPLALYPGIRIAQLVFHMIDAKVEEYAGKYALQTRPMFSEVSRESDLFVHRPVERDGAAARKRYIAEPHSSGRAFTLSPSARRRPCGVSAWRGYDVSLTVPRAWRCGLGSSLTMEHLRSARL
jgi:deoxycytidine triphosphate deaminase